VATATRRICSNGIAHHTAIMECERLFGGRRASGIPIAAGILYLRFGILLFPIIAAEAMALSSATVIGNAPRWRVTRMPNWLTSRFRPE
jgi:hypothetical protein